MSMPICKHSGGKELPTIVDELMDYAETKAFTRSAYVELGAKYNELLNKQLDTEQRALKLELGIENAIAEMILNAKAWVEDNGEQSIATGIIESIEVLKKHTKP